MNAETAINAAIVAFLATATVVLYRLCRTQRPSEAQRVAAARLRVGLTVWDFAAEKWIDLAPGGRPGPGQMTARDVAEADPLELLYLAPAYDPGIDRLRQAIRDEQQNGDQL